MIWNEDRQIEQAREQLVIKDNRLLQTVTKRKYELKAQEQKALGFLLSKIKPEDQYRKPPFIYEFDITEFCKVCGIDADNGKNFINVKQTLENLSSNGFWLKKMTKEGKKSSLYFQWIVTPEIMEGGKIAIEIPSKVFPYLAGLSEKFMQYELWQILALKSTYSIALYEFLKSYAYKKEVTVSLEELRGYLGLDENKYRDFKNFKQKILNVAKNEINELTDLEIEWQGIRHGRFYTQIKFDIKTKVGFHALEAYRRSTAILNGIKHTEGQLNMFE